MKNTLLQINNDGMGQGDPELGLILIQNYLRLLIQEETLPAVIAFYNAGVKLVAEGSPVVDELRAMEEKGVKLIACKTCLNHFGIIDKVQVGIKGTMIDIINLQKEAAKVLTL